MTVSALAADTHATEDLLGFTPHAQRLAKTILGLPKDHSFVIGIEGEWGEGKSSFIKLLNQAFRDETDLLRPTLVEFNPWWFEGSDQLMRHFFDELFAQIDWSKEAGSKAKEALAKLAYGLKKASKIIEYVPVGISKDLLEKLAEVVEPQKQTESIADLRQSAKSTLGALQFKTVVFIDDLDRLPPNEVNELFRVIKAVADLPNIVYVVAYDRAIVASALDSFHKDKGEAYLEKIIQLPYRLPKPTGAHRRAYYHKVLNELPLVRDCAGEDKETALDFIIAAFLPTPRDVKRLYVALLGTQHLPAEIGMSSLDFIFLEAMRIKYRKIWSAFLAEWQRRLDQSFLIDGDFLSRQMKFESFNQKELVEQAIRFFCHPDSWPHREHTMPADKNCLANLASAGRIPEATARSRQWYVSYQQQLAAFADQE
ncbi:P-loop NTPase fold protein [Vogesella sp. AC12]|uniref:KAP family P-loop NTPase fold protein n=1 Tax=Vogesella sp. AC12 TaxID=2950550 RepID=UPI002109F2B4|nr:P-loop NTPase fold protein [Vogesella sp. AC12]MCQ4144167.1 KAP family NTPase [Vogesella sp. AC12]